MLLLMSPFRSIEDVVGTLIGRWAKIFIKDRFKNIEHIQEVECPVFIIHGAKDTLIPKEHAEDLHSHCKNISQILIPDEMDHNNFDFYDDLCQPLLEFMAKIRFSPNPNPNLGN